MVAVLAGQVDREAPPVGVAAVAQPTQRQRCRLGQFTANVGELAGSEVLPRSGRASGLGRERATAARARPSSIAAEWPCSSCCRFSVSSAGYRWTGDDRSNDDCCLGWLKVMTCPDVIVLTAAQRQSLARIVHAAKSTLRWPCARGSCSTPRPDAPTPRSPCGWASASTPCASGGSGGRQPGRGLVDGRQTLRATGRVHAGAGGPRQGAGLPATVGRRGRCRGGAAQSWRARR